MAGPRLKRRWSDDVGRTVATQMISVRFPTLTLTRFRRRCRALEITPSIVLRYLVAYAMGDTDDETLLNGIRSGTDRRSAS